MSQGAKRDPLGHALLAERMIQAQRLAVDFWQAEPAMEAFVPAAGGERMHFYCSGLGTSEAHARYQAYLIGRYTPHTASYLSTTEIDQNGFPAIGENAALAVFTQGLSANAQIVLRAWPHRERLVLFTAASVERLAAGGQTARAELLATLEARGAQVVRFPLADEYTILIRVVGPLLGYLAAARWLERSLGGRLPTLSSSALEHLLAQAVTDAATADADMARVSGLWATGALAGYAQNLLCKWVEGLFLPTPEAGELFAFAHGPFQSACAGGREQWFFSTPHPRSRDLAARARDLCAAGGVPAREISAPADEPWAILYFEVWLNERMRRALQGSSVNQRDWPGQGLDGPLYQLDGR